MIGRYPTPVHAIPELSRPGWELWIKRDDRTSNLYGGNKVRKLERILEQARIRGARRIVTFGAAGSHHVLATALYGRSAGFDVLAILTPQPAEPHALLNLRVSLGLGVDARPAPRFSAIPSLLAPLLRRGDYLVPPGGSNVAGTLGYVDAARELAVQLRQGALPPPDMVFVALGSGGTAAGLLAGLALEGLAAKVVGVRVVEPWMAGAFRTAALARLAGRVRGYGPGAGIARLLEKLEIEPRYLGAGYGCSTHESRRAIAVARDLGLSMDPVYTAKTFAAVLDRRKDGVPARVLYWHTFSSAPLEPLLAAAPPESEIPKELVRLLIR